MDYGAIYTRFIADRRPKEAALLAVGAYVERHHIRPRALGGSDEPSNLINLTPEDHFFAHLLLAKSLGGKMWRPILIMASLAPTRRGVTAAKVARMRRHYAAARKALSREGNNKFNATLFVWTNLDTGESVTACIYDMHKRYGGSRPSWTSASTGYRLTLKGWTAHPDRVRIRGLKGRVLAFVNRDGREFTGTQSEFCEMAGLSAAGGTRVSRDGSVTRCGWRLQGVEDRAYHQPKDGSRPGPTPEVFTLERDGERLVGGRVELAQRLGTTPGSVAACIRQIRNGKMQTFKGYRLVAKSG